jgi:arsenite methyltransferase
MAQVSPDAWMQWLLQGRFGGAANEDKIEKQRNFLYQVRDTLLKRAGIRSGDCVLDIGCGDGLMAFKALELVGENGQVIFSDISQPLLEHCQSLAQQKGVLERCQFLQASAEDLGVLPDNSVDIITMRSVLIYVQDKQRAFSEFYRVLRPRGRLVFFEPIYRYRALNRFGDPPPDQLFYGYDARAISSIVDKVRAVFDRYQPPGTDPMLNFDEDDLLTFIQEAGFTAVAATLQMNFNSTLNKSTWEEFLEIQSTPLVPTIGEAIAQSLTPQEAEQLEAHLRPLVESGRGLTRTATIYLSAAR